MAAIMGIPLPLQRLSNGAHPASAEQLVLIGQPRPIRVPEGRWRSWLDDPAVVARFESKRYKRADDLCWVWMAAVSSTGHGSFRAASLPGPTRRGTVPAHLFAYQLEHGVIPRLGWSSGEDAVICHQCDFAGCANPGHMRLGTNATNRVEYFARRRNLANPLADVRGAAGRTRAVAAAIRTGLADHDDAASIEVRIRSAEAAGLPLTLW
ncbi:MAG: hypothetical protein QOF88_3870 [Mycobacterium sp.]|jgi:hypothetical protein|nr:hypothetical protein [Mycobacterium sp.]MDT5288981.1 hypothetical protein [Mycobacterium sp.]